MDSNTPIWPVDSLPTPLIGRRRQVLPRPIVTQFESKRLRVRRNHQAPIKVFEVSWNFTFDQYAFFVLFFKETLEQGTLSFSMETLEHHYARGYVRRYTRELAFLDATYNFIQSDNLVEVDASLEQLEESYVLIEDPFDPVFIRAEQAEALVFSTAFLYGSCTDVPFVDEIAMPVSFESGELFDVIHADSWLEEAAMSVGFTAGEIINQDSEAEGQDAAAMGVALVSGVLFDTIMATGTKTDSIGMGVALVSGTCPTVAINPGNITDSAGMSVGFVGGAIA